MYSSSGNNPYGNQGNQYAASNPFVQNPVQQQQQQQQSQQQLQPQQQQQMLAGIPPGGGGFGGQMQPPQQQMMMMPGPNGNFTQYASYSRYPNQPGHQRGRQSHPWYGPPSIVAVG